MRDATVGGAKIGIGILSFAHGHVNAYARMIQGFDDARLVACWDHDMARGQAGAERYGIPFVPHLEDILARQDIDCVIIASETNRHADLAVAALEADKPVLLQKPMATTLEGCDRIIRAVEQSGQWFSMAFQMRCDPQNIAMRRLIHEGAVGRVGFIRRRHCIPVLFNKGFIEGETAWHISAEANVGMFFDDATHALDWLYWTVGARPVSVMAEIDNVLTDVAPDDTGAAILRFADGMFATITNTSVCWAGENTTEIYGDQGVIIQNHGDAPSAAIQPAHPVGVKLYQQARAELGWQDLGLPLVAGQGERIAGVARPFVDAFKAGMPMCSAEEGRVSVEMALACYRSAETGERVGFPYGE
jgi:predicted dehydrogenase